MVTLHRLAQEQAEDLFIAHRGYNEHVLRVVYEYESDIPLVVTVYFPYAKRYFQGGGTYADQILS
ncbi:MAG: hypothetical protein EXS64_16140 [Candidatus Latescibacteria bacterium]|nr:hypothetical protein [Candidatus Latescibacterota bacterium]